MNIDTEESFIERIVEKVMLALETEIRVGWLDNEEEGNRLSRRSASFSEKGDKSNNEQRCRTYQIPSRGLSGGLAIAIRKDIDFNIISGFRGLDGGFDILGIRTINLSINFNVVSVYRRPGGSLRVNDFRPLFDFDPGGCESIFLGDFNAKNTLWNCEYMDTIWESLQEAMERRDFMCVNMDTCSRIGAIGERDSNLDLLFCSAAVLDNIKYNQLDDTWDSDHFPIVFKLETHRGIYSSDGLSVRYSGFTKVLTDAAHEATDRRPNQLSGGKRIRREKSGNPNSW
ncbi:PREDICTED: uncharacterized protein LOC108764142 [Trachymyrmex cornetzi]|uniref:uncharacterized protein LOC108764142 n=1 Tax=Trachymyrmex cornetzi TaxID=471704 RepID=UPI00084F0FBD|nr:PREDICTED: uncharacterized protein LOC108764142 [Trachymyrmex cornetzi]